MDHAFDGRQGVQKIKEKRPDLMILDLTMPVMDGWVVLMAIKKNPDYSAIPVIILTSSKEMSHIHKAKKLGVESYLIKPLVPQKLSRVVRSLLEGEEIEESEKYSGLLDGDLIQKNGL